MKLLKPLLLTSAILAAYPAMAQTTNPAPVAATEIAEIVVTARRVSEKLQDVPLSRATAGRGSAASSLDLRHPVAQG